MKAPDEIFINPDLDNRWFRLGTTKEDTAYIRKDTLWKPSKEQIKALWRMMKYGVSLSAWNELEKPIESLYNDLNKLLDGTR